MKFHKLISKAVILGTLFIISLSVNSFAAISGSVFGDNVNVRKDSRLDSEVIAKVGNGTSLTIVSSEGDFYKVNFNDKSNVYIAKQFVKLNGSNIKINDSSVNIRASASTNANIVGTVTAENVFKLKAVEGEWCLIEHSSGSAYVHTSFVEMTNDNVADASAKAPVLEADTRTNTENQGSASVFAADMYAVVKSDTGLNLRKTPSADGEIIMVLSNNVYLDIYEVSDQWVKVSFNGTDGYVNTEFISVENGKKPASDVVNQDKAQAILAYAKQFLGTPYVYGGTNLNKGVDCSGFVYSVMSNFGIKLGRSSRDMYRSNGYAIEKNNVKPADLLFFSADGTNISHVAIYIGDNKYIHSTDAKSKGVSYGNLTDSYSSRTFVGVKRIID